MDSNWREVWGKEILSANEIWQTVSNKTNNELKSMGQWMRREIKCEDESQNLVILKRFMNYPNWNEWGVDMMNSHLIEQIGRLLASRSLCLQEWNINFQIFFHSSPPCFTLEWIIEKEFLMAWKRLMNFYVLSSLYSFFCIHAEESKWSRVNVGADTRAERRRETFFLHNKEIWNAQWMKLAYWSRWKLSFLEVDSLCYPLDGILTMKRNLR